MTIWLIMIVSCAKEKFQIKNPQTTFSKFEYDTTQIRVGNFNHCWGVVAVGKKRYLCEKMDSIVNFAHSQCDHNNQEVIYSIQDGQDKICIDRHGCTDGGKMIELRKIDSIYSSGNSDTCQMPTF